MEILSQFINSYFLWRDPMIVGAFTGAICGFLGVYVVLRRIIFVSATLTQISSFGVALSFYLEGIGLAIFSSLVGPFAISLILTVIAAAFYALKRDFSHISREGLIAFGFLLASGGVIILGDRITKGAHDISTILFGSAVVVDPVDVYLIPGVAILAFVIHLIYYKDFIFVSFDTESAKLFKYPVRGLNILLLITVALVVAVSTRALGALPVFALLALPPLSSLYLTEKFKLLFVFSVVIGILSAVLGYFFSFILSIPTGASITVCASIIFILSAGWRQIRFSS